MKNKMNKLTLLVTITAIAFFSNACKKDTENNPDHNHGSSSVYHIHRHLPMTSSEMFGTTDQIKIDFESHNGSAVHHVNVSLYRKSDDSLIFSEPRDAHVMEKSGKYQYSKTIHFIANEGFAPHTDYKLVSKVWGHTALESIATDTFQFHVYK